MAHRASAFLGNSAAHWITLAMSYEGLSTLLAG
jgi:hypothetical protein